jgi:hypothetical protein
VGTRKCTWVPPRSTPSSTSSARNGSGTLAGSASRGPPVERGALQHLALVGPEGEVDHDHLAVRGEGSVAGREHPVGGARLGGGHPLGLPLDPREVGHRLGCDREQLDLEDQGRAGGDRAVRGAPLAVAQLGGDGELEAVADLHRQQALVPTLDHVSQPELGRDSALHRRVEHAPVLQPTGVVDPDTVTEVGGVAALTLGQDRVLESRVGGHDLGVDRDDGDPGGGGILIDRGGGGQGRAEEQGEHRVSFGVSARGCQMPMI